MLLNTLRLVFLIFMFKELNLCKYNLAMLVCIASRVRVDLHVRISNKFEIRINMKFILKSTY